MQAQAQGMGMAMDGVAHTDRSFRDYQRYDGQPCSGFGRSSLSDMQQIYCTNIPLIGLGAVVQPRSRGRGRYAGE